MGLDKLIENRVSSRSLGFAAEIQTGDERQKNAGKNLSQLEPADLAQYGLIPEFIGRLPVVSVLEPLKKQDLIRILGEPKNALTKQYQKLFSYNGVELNFEKKALSAVAEQALKSKTGARGLRKVLEDSMLEIMYEAPSDSEITECLITEEVIRKKTGPKFSYKSRKKSAKTAATSAKEKEKESA